MSAVSTAVEIAAATIPAVGGSYWAYRASKKALEVSARQQTDAVDAKERTSALKIESEAYARAREIYESALVQLEHQLDRLQTQLDRVNDLLARERDNSTGLRVQIHGLEQQIHVLELTVTQLRRQLARVAVDTLEEVTTTDPSDLEPVPDLDALPGLDGEGAA